jgi:hypothetical protein
VFCLVVMNKILGTWLSMCIIVDSFCVNPSSFNKFHNHIVFLVALLIAIYLVSIVDNAIVGCCLLFQIYYCIVQKKDDVSNSQFSFVQIFTLLWIMVSCKCHFIILSYSCKLKPIVMHTLQIYHDSIYSSQVHIPWILHKLV